MHTYLVHLFGDIRGDFERAEVLVGEEVLAARYIRAVSLLIPVQQSLNGPVVIVDGGVGYTKKIGRWALIRKDE